MEICIRQQTFVGAVVLDLSKAFESIPHDILFAKLHAYGFNQINMTLFHLYLKQHKQNVKINNTHSLLKKLVSEMRQGSILGLMLFNICINDLFLWLSEILLTTIPFKSFF